VTIVVHAGAAITSGSTAAFVAGASGSFAITTSGAPSANLSLSGSLPKGLTFSTTGGTGTISGTARKAQIGSSTVVVHASNGVGDPDAQVLTVVVGTLPKLSAAARVSVLRGGSLAVTVSAKGSPTPTITASGLEGWQRATGGLSGGLTISGAAPSGGPPRVITLTLSATNLLGTTTRTLLVRIR